MIRIAYFGAHDFSKNILKDLVSNDEIKVELVISQPDKKVGRKQEIEETPVKLLAKENNIEVIQPLKLKENNDLFTKLKKLNLDFIVVVAYGKIIPKEILNIPKYYSINIHGSILPKYRGASPVQESLKNGDSETGLTIMKMSEKMDEGDILNIKKFNINIHDKTPDIFNKFESFGANLLIETLKKIIQDDLKGIPQDNNKATYCSKIEKIDGKVSFKEEVAKKIYDKYRAYYTWPGIYTEYNEKKFSIEDCFFTDIASTGEPGNVIKLENTEIGIKCGKGILIIYKVKLEGKKEMNIKDFINGNKDFLNYKFN